jgi:hypothetical protein
MLTHGERCRHCGGEMSAAKQVVDGPKKGQTRKYCLKCGHIEFLAQPGSPPQQQH